MYYGIYILLHVFTPSEYEVRHTYRVKHPTLILVDLVVIKCLSLAEIQIIIII